MVVGSSERAFYGNQFPTMALLFDHYGVDVWVPELGGTFAVAERTPLLRLEQGVKNLLASNSQTIARPRNDRA